MKTIFERIQSLHTQMMLNPFYNFDSHGSFLTGGNSNPGRMTVGRSAVILGEDDDMSDYSSSSCSSCNSSNNEQTSAPQPATPLNSKKINDECIESLKRQVDAFVTQCDINLRSQR